VGIPAAWLSLDHADNDPKRFWSHFVAALQTVPGLEEAWVENQIPLLQQNPTTQNDPSFLVDLIGAIATISWHFVLILDDFQAITESAVLDGLFYLLENLPPGSTGMHLVLSSRNDPPWPLARLRAGNEIIEIRSRDLSFRRDETAAFINLMGLALSPGEIAKLDQRTEGWIAGLQMAALSMQNRDDLSLFIEDFTGSHRFVLDYLVEEVLSKQKPEILDFLLKTSILDRMTGPLCDSVTGNSNGIDILQQLEKTNLFLVALDDQRRWYRYHHLFAGLLQKQLRTRYFDEIPALHIQASQWYAQHGFPIMAVRHALKSEDWAYAAELIEENILDVIQGGEMILARQWISALPEGTIRLRPILCVAQAWTSAQYATVTMAEDLLVQAEATLATATTEDGFFDSQVYESVSRQMALLQVVIARLRGDSIDKQQTLALDALDHLIPADDTASRATLLLRLGLSYIDLGKDEQADKTFSQSFELGRSSGNLYAAYVANYGRMVIARRHGQLQALDAICRQSLESSTKLDTQRRSLHGIALVMSGDLYYEWNNLDLAARQLIQGLRLVEEVGMAELLIKGHFALACLKIVQGKAEPLPDLEKLAENSSPGLTHYAAALQMRYYLLLPPQFLESQIEAELTRWSESQQFLFREQSAYDWEMREILIYARVLCRQYGTQPDPRLKTQLEDVLNFIEGQCQPLDDLSWRGTLVEVYIVMALVLHSLERETEALSKLEMALNLAEPQGYQRIFLDEGDPMRELLQRAQAEGFHKAYTYKLLSPFEGKPRSAVPISPLNPAKIIDPLTAREMQVLRLLNSRLNVPEIAEKIHLAPTTVRTHVQHIYQKLGVHGRLEAIQRAEELGLL
jgi:LuxR family maltose regulon positive regulatory protein